MSKINTIIRKIIALILVVVVTSINMPTSTIFAADESIDEVTFTVEVIGAESEEITDAKFVIDGIPIKEDNIIQEMTNDETSGESVLTNKYTITIPKPSDGVETINVYQDSYKNHRGIVEYNEENEEYIVELKRYADITNNNISVDGETYNAEILYSDGLTYTLEFNDIVACTSEEANLTNEDGGKKWTMIITEPGEIEVTIKSGKKSEFTIEECTFNLNVTNELYFSFEENQSLYANDSSVKFIADATDDKKVGTITKTVSGNDTKFSLTVGGAYTSDITYSKSGDSASEVDSKSGEVTICDDKPVTVTATCNKTGVTATYILAIEKISNELEVDLNNVSLSDGDVIKIPVFNKADEYKLNAAIKNSAYADFYNITYNSNNFNEVSVDSTGNITVNDMLASSACITITATPTAGIAYFLDTTVFKVYVTTIHGNVVTEVYYGEGDSIRQLSDGSTIQLDDQVDITKVIMVNALYCLLLQN